MTNNVEYLQKPKSLETEAIVKSNTEMKVAEYATISGIKGYQFGREIFSAVLKFKDLEKFLQVFPEVQRTASGRKIGQIKNYILSGIEDRSNLRFFNGVTVTTRGSLFYDEQDKSIAIDISSSKLSINDGQHRTFAIAAAIQELKRRIAKGRNKDIQELNKRYLEELSEMMIPLTIFNNISEDMEKQLFHDINNLQSRPSKSSTIRLSQNDLLSRMARELSETNHYLLKYGVEYNKMSISGQNLNTVLLTTVYIFCKNMFRQELRNNSDFITDKNYENCKQIVNDTMNKMFKALPQDLHIKNKYILSRGYALRSIADFIYEKSRDITINEDSIYEAISKVNWNLDINFWSSYGAMLSEKGHIIFGGHDQGGLLGVKKACEYELEIN